jgi:hypothetical protein
MASAAKKKRARRATTCVPYQVTDTGGDRKTGENAGGLKLVDMWSGDSLGDTNGVACIGS